MQLVPISLAQARRFVAEHHSHNGPTNGWKFGVGVECDGQLVAVGVCEPVKARLLGDDRCIEIVRVATDRTRMACSMVYGALCRAAKALGYLVAYTYTLASECASCVKAAGFVFDAFVSENSGWSRVNRPRVDIDLFGTPTKPLGEKVRWRRDL